MRLGHIVASPVDIFFAFRHNACARRRPGQDPLRHPRAREKAIYAGGHGEVAIPVPIPNTEVKHLCADDTAESGKVGSCRLFYFKPRLWPGGQAGCEGLAVSWPAASVLIQFPSIPPLALDMVCPPVLWWCCLNPFYLRFFLLFD